MAVIPASRSQSTLTDRYQTTVPEAVRKALGLNKRDKIQYTIEPDGKVVISRVDEAGSDRVLEKFLDFLAKDIETNPQHLQRVTADLVNRIQSVLPEMDIDLDAPLSDEDE